jgi:hypothetical protein
MSRKQKPKQVAPAVCCRCINDPYLQRLVQEGGSVAECTECGGTDKPTFSAEEFGELLAPLVLEHFRQGDEVHIFSNAEDEKGYWEQQGQELHEIIEEVLGQYFSIQEEIIEATVDSEAKNLSFQDGESGELGREFCYVERHRISEYEGRWVSTYQSLQNSKRFFNEEAKKLFDDLFQGIEELKTCTSEEIEEPVIRTVPIGAEIFRGRLCTSDAMRNEFYADPLLHVGPPPPLKARAGRMNADHIAVLYGAMEKDTCLAELRPALGSESLVITLVLASQHRVLDFARLERSGKSLSYFQPDFANELDRETFLRKLHRLISQPIVPGRESEYLITQTMAEYLAHVHPGKLDGIMFSSVQRSGGTNIVLFGNDAGDNQGASKKYGIDYVQDSTELYLTTSMQYMHLPLEVIVDGKGKAWVSAYPGDDNY